MDVYNRLVSVGWIERISWEFSEKEIKDLRNKYRADNTLIWLTSQSHTKIVNRAYLLAESVFVRGGTMDEVHLALENLLICLDSDRYRLDWKQYQTDKSIKDLELKFLKFA